MTSPVFIFSLITNPKNLSKESCRLPTSRGNFFIHLEFQLCEKQPILNGLIFNTRHNQKRVNREKIRLSDQTAFAIGPENTSNVTNPSLAKSKINETLLTAIPIEKIDGLSNRFRFQVYHSYLLLPFHPVLTPSFKLPSIIKPKKVYTIYIFIIVLIEAIIS